MTSSVATMKSSEETSSAAGRGAGAPGSEPMKPRRIRSSQLGLAPSSCASASSGVTWSCSATASGIARSTNGTPSRSASAGAITVLPAP